MVAMVSPQRVGGSFLQNYNLASQCFQRLTKSMSKIIKDSLELQNNLKTPETSNLISFIELINDFEGDLGLTSHPDPLLHFICSFVFCKKKMIHFLLPTFHTKIFLILVFL